VSHDTVSGGYPEVGNYSAGVPERSLSVHA